MLMHLLFPGYQISGSFYTYTPTETHPVAMDPTMRSAEAMANSGMNTASVILPSLRYCYHFINVCIFLISHFYFHFRFSNFLVCYLSYLVIYIFIFCICYMSLFSLYAFCISVLVITLS